MLEDVIIVLSVLQSMLLSLLVLLILCFLLLLMLVFEFILEFIYVDNVVVVVVAGSGDSGCNDVGGFSVGIQVISVSGVGVDVNVNTATNIEYTLYHGYDCAGLLLIIHFKGRKNLHWSS